MAEMVFIIGAKFHLNVSGINVMVNMGDGKSEMVINSQPNEVKSEMKAMNSQPNEGHETFLIKRFEQMKEVFVETKRYREARSKLLENHYLLLTGSSGEGKTFIAMKLIHEQTQQGHRFKEITSNKDFHEFYNEKMVFLIDDAFQIDNQENQWLVLEIEKFIEEEIQRKSNYLIITSRKRPFSQIKEKMKQSWLLEGESVIDFGNGELELTKEEKTQIVLKHINKFKPDDTNNFVKSGKANEIAEIVCTGFANCVYLFVRNQIWFNTGLDFFKHHVDIVRKELDNLKDKDPDVYLLLIYLLLKGGRIKGSSLDECDKDDGVLSILQKIYFYPKPSYCSILNSALQRVEYAYVSRVHSSGTITFRHDCIVEAVCMSFSKILPRDAIMNVPFEFISKRMRTEDYRTDIYNMIIISGDRYDNLAKRFIEELKLGNIKSICEHPAFNNEIFVDQFIENVIRSNISAEITERACGSTLNGSLLYWSASCGAENLCRKILESDIYTIVTDTFWLRTQASVALVPSCWYGFRWSVIELLLKLGADINSSIHAERSFQTYTSDFLAVHDLTGWTPIQAVLDGTNTNKSTYVQDLINKGCMFQERWNMNRPLILAVKEGNMQLVEVLLKNGVNVNAVDMRHTSAIETAIELNQVEIAGLLLERIIIQNSAPLCRPKTIKMMRLFEAYFDLQTKDEEGRSLLHYAEDSELVEFLLRKGLSVNMLDKRNRTPLYYATSEEVVFTLLKHGGSLIVDNEKQNTFFHIHKNVKVIENVLEKLASNVKHKYINARNSCRLPPIFVANTDVLECLLKNGADVNIKCPYAAQRKQSSEIYARDCTETNARGEFAEKYVNMDNVSINTQSMDSYASGDHYEKRDNCNENVTSESNDGIPQIDMTVVMMLALKGKLSMHLLALFLKHDYDIALKDGNGQTILHYIVSPIHHLKDVCQLLETIVNHARLQLNQRGGDINISDLVNHPNVWGNTVLHLACSCCCLNKLTRVRLDVVKKLLQFEANQNIRNLCSETALHKLMQCHCCPKLDILKSFHELSEFQSDNETLNHLFKSHQPEEIKQDALSDCLAVVKYLLRERKSVNRLSIFNKMIESETNINLLMPILSEEIWNLNDTERKVLFDICIRKQHQNTALLLLFMHSEKESVVSRIDIYDTFTLCVRMLVDPSNAIAVLKKLLHIGMDVNHEIKSGTSLLSWTLKNAPKDHKSKIIEFLLQNGATIRHTDLIRYCLISYEDDECTLRCLELLLEHGMKISDGIPLIWALNSATIRPNTIKFLLNHRDIDHHQMDAKKKTAFHYLLEKCSQSTQNEAIVPLFRCLIQKLNINRPLRDGSSAFTLALKCPNIPKSVVFEIAQHLSDINSKDSVGRSPLHNVILYYQGYDELDIVKHMIKLGADMDFQTVDKSGRNFLHHLVSRMKYHTVKILLFHLSKVAEDKKVENVNSRDVENDSALHIASSFNVSDPKHDLLSCASLRIPVVRILLANGADKNATNKENQTALHILVKYYVYYVENDKLVSHIHHIHPIIELVNLLVESGIDLSIQDSDGKTALQYLLDNRTEFILLKQMITKKVKPEVIILAYEGLTQQKK